MDGTARRLILTFLLVIVGLVYWWTRQSHYPWLFVGTTVSYYGETG